MFGITRVIVLLHQTCGQRAVITRHCHLLPFRDLRRRMHGAQLADHILQPRRIGNQVAIRRDQILGTRRERCLNRKARCGLHRPVQLWRQVQIADPDALGLQHHRARRIKPRQRHRQRTLKRLLRRLRPHCAEQRTAMVGQPLQINDLHTNCRQQVQHLGLGSTCVAIQQNDRDRRGCVIQRIRHQLAPGLVATSNRLHPPADLRQNGCKRS